MVGESMAKFNPLEEMFKKVYFGLQFKKKYPQCAECEYVNEVSFSSEYYNDCLKNEVCIKCDKFENGDVNE